MSIFPEPTEGAHRVLAYFFILFGILNLLPNSHYGESYHRYPAGPVAGFFYIVSATCFLMYSYTRKPKDKDKS